MKYRYLLLKWFKKIKKGIFRKKFVENSQNRGLMRVER